MLSHLDPPTPLEGEGGGILRYAGAHNCSICQEHEVVKPCKALPPDKVDLMFCVLVTLEN